MAGERENVAIFNPLVLPLPSWHPNGPDGAIDGYVIPFVAPASGRDAMVDELAGYVDNRAARIEVRPDARIGWHATAENVNAWRVYTAAQARALAAAWIRAAEVLENVVERAPEPATDGVVDAEVVEDDDNPGPDQPGHVHEDCCK